MLDYAVISEVGSRRVNEDQTGTAEKDGRYCFLVCDGLGGHGMGDVASRFVTNIFLEQFQMGASCDGYLSAAFLLAQERLLEHQKENKAANKMRTTAAVLTVDETHAFIGHIGDSRVYVFDEAGVKRRTVDHSVPQMLALSGKIREEDIRRHPDRNIILRAMGAPWEDPMYELQPAVPLSACRAFLLCSDGFWEYIEERKMSELLHKSASAQQWLNAMTAEVVRNGAQDRMDNYSAVAVLNLAYGRG